MKIANWTLRALTIVLALTGLLLGVPEPWLTIIGVAVVVLLLADAGLLYLRKRNSRPKVDQHG